jgi:uncharacterized protein YbaP (TraB family)
MREVTIQTVVALLISVSVVWASTAGSENKTSLWKVSSPANSVYLLGSIHMLASDDYPLPEGMETAFKHADVVVFEVDPDSLQSPALQTYILSHAMYEQGKTLKSELGETAYANLYSMAESLEINLDLMNGYKPWFVSLSLPLLEMQRLGFSPELGVDFHFAGKAREGGKTILGLETARYQVDLFVSIEEERQRDLLEQTLGQLSDIEKDLDNLVTGWRAGDLAAVERILNKSLKKYPDLQETFLLQRNRNWVKEIAGYLTDERDYLVIVGVGHMAGEEGLIRLLEKSGHDVEQQ